MSRDICLRCRGTSVSDVAAHHTFTVASNRTLTGIAAARPGDAAALIEIHGVGPSFVSKYAPEVLAIVADHPPALTPAA